jgi:acetoin utilization protein AcuB
VTARELKSDILIPLRPEDTGITALGLMDELRVAHLPVVGDGEYLGLVSDFAVYNMHDPDAGISTLRPSLKHVYVSENQHIYDVIRLVAENKISLLPVLSDKGQFLGVITLQELIAQLAIITSAGNPGSIIVLEINDKDYLLTEIAQIVEANDAKVLSLYVSTFHDSTRMEITLKLNRMDIGPVLQTFSRFNYTIKASFSENTYFESLQERYDSLMNYLNI